MSLEPGDRDVPREAQSCPSARAERGSPGPTANPEKKTPLRVFKNGGFIFSAKVEPNDRDGIELTIDALQSALKKARLLKRKLGAE